MMLLKDLVQGICIQPLPQCYHAYDVAVLSCDSREPMANGLFVALPGFKVDGTDFIQQAIAQGAKTVVKKGQGRHIKDYVIPDDVCVLDVEDPKDFLKLAAQRFYEEPSAKVKVLGVTGTNGKTTFTYLMESIIHAATRRCGVVGTINYRIGAKILPSKNTTPGLLENQRHLSQLADEGVEFCVMEVSSHALEQGRVDGIHFASAVFTNLTQDHLDYHKDMEQYFQAKSLLFKNAGSHTHVIINKDDAYGRRLIELTKGSVTTYGLQASADVSAQEIHYQLGGTILDLHFPSGVVPIRTRLIGQHNVYNMLSAAACAFAQGFTLEAIGHGLEMLRYVPGRLEPVDGTADFFVFIDYAHTEDGLINVLQSLRAVSQERIIVVFGCGGDRDRGKRPKMGQAVCRLADHAIVTSDNPRSEEPQAIIDEIVTGFDQNNYEICIDRREAIHKALSIARKGEIVLIAGKGHEDYQIFKDRTISFNERQIVEDFFVHH